MDFGSQMVVGARPQLTEGEGEGERG